MAQQQDITYQYDLFNQSGEEFMRPFVRSEAVCGASTTKALQVKEACEQGRALAPDLMGAILCHSNIKQAYKQVKQNKGVAGIDQMPVGEFAAWYGFRPNRSAHQALKTGFLDTQKTSVLQVKTMQEDNHTPTFPC